MHKGGFICLFIPLLFSQAASDQPLGDTDDSISDEQRVVIDPSLRAERKCRPPLAEV